MRDVTEQEAQRLISFARDRLGRQEGDGQCWTLVNNGFSALDFHKPSSTYAWGREVEQLSEARPGDVFQFTNFRVDVSVDNPDGGGYDEFAERGTPRHTAILVSIDGNGLATFLECNIGGSFSVQQHAFHVRTADWTNDEGRRTRVVTRGSFTVYRPQMVEAQSE